MRARRADADDHDGLAVSAERELEEPRQLGVPIRHVVLLPRIAQRVDAAPEREQGLVDVGPFQQPLAAVLRRAGPFAAGQVDDAERGHRVRLVDVGVSVPLRDVDLEHGMRPRRRGVGLRRRHRSLLVPFHDHVHDLLDLAERSVKLIISSSKDGADILRVVAR